MAVSARMRGIVVALNCWIWNFSDFWAPQFKKGEAIVSWDSSLSAVRTTTLAVGSPMGTVEPAVVGKGVDRFVKVPVISRYKYVDYEEDTDHDRKRKHMQNCIFLTLALWAHEITLSHTAHEKFSKEYWCHCIGEKTIFDKAVMFSQVFNKNSSSKKKSSS